MTPRKKKDLDNSNFVVGDKKEWRSKIDAPPTFLRESTPPLPQPSISNLPDEDDDMPAMGGYIKPKKVTITMSKKAIFILAFAQVLLGAFFYLGGFGTATYIHYHNDQKEKASQQAIKEKQAAQRPAVTDRSAPALPFGVASQSPNPVGIYAVEVKQFRMIDNAIKAAHALWQDKYAAYVVGFKDGEGASLFAVRIGAFETLDLASQEVEKFAKATQLPANAVISKEGEDKFTLSVAPDKAGV